MADRANRHLRALGLLLACLALPAAVRAEPVELKVGRYVARGQWIELSVGFREMSDATFRRRLRSGFATTVLMRLYLYRAGGNGTGRGRALAVISRSLRVLYDLWEGQFVLQIDDPGLPTRTVRTTQESRVIDLLTSIWRFPLVDVKALAPGSAYVVAGLVEVNPMSREVLTEVRRWLRKPQSRQRGGTGENFFGSFVSIFVNDKIRRAEKVFRFRTQPFVLPR